ncbi:MAG TPA: twin-arginine translocase subunit TatC [Bacteroidia bacterium]|jgi:sec-independent protein translocase protein TatC|nr:twin-arginine translocase subunit TatC [Bacteroidia bacterium]
MALFGNSSSDKKDMSFLDHIEVLRWHLVRSAIVVLVLAVVLFCYNNIVFDVIIFGPKQPDFITYRALCKLSNYVLHNNSMCIGQAHYELINLELAGQFTTHIWISLVGGIILSVPYLVWELWRFIKPALKLKEKMAAKGFVFYASLLFLIGILFSYFVIVPLTVSFLGSYQMSTLVENRISMDSYISLVTTLTLAMGLVFELPIVVYFLTKIGLLGPAFLKTYRKHAIVVILIVAAFITPSPDITSQLLVAFPLFILYEVSILVSKRADRKRPDPA